MSRQSRFVLLRLVMVMGAVSAFGPSSSGSTLVLESGAAGDRFGYCIDANGDLVGVGAPGHNLVHLFALRTRQGELEIEASDTLHPPDGTGQTQFGRSVSIRRTSDGYIVAVGAPGSAAGLPTNAGRVYIFERTDGGRFAHVLTLESPSPRANEALGESVELIDDDTVLVGTDNNQPGGAYLFSTTSGELVREFNKPTGAPGFFGLAVSGIAGKYAIGAPGSLFTESPEAGAVYIYDGTSDDYSEVLVAHEDAQDDWFSVGLHMFANGDVLVGEPGGDGVHPWGVSDVVGRKGRMHLFTATGVADFEAPAPARDDFYRGLSGFDSQHLLAGAFMADPDPDGDLACNRGEAYYCDLTVDPKCDLPLELSSLVDDELVCGDNFGRRVVAYERGDDRYAVVSERVGTAAGPSRVFVIPLPPADAKLARLGTRPRR